VYSLQGVSQEIVHFMRGCEHLLSALASRRNFSETEKQMIAYYWKEVTSQTQFIRDELG